jgi:hypothetical protein
VQKPEEKNHLEDLGIGGRIILNWILGLICGNEPLSSIKYREFID